MESMAGGTISACDERKAAMASLPSISLVIPTYRRPRQLTSCLEAVGSLDYPPDRLEVIVVDDGGAGQSALSETRLGRLHCRLLRQTNAGPAAARNLGASHAAGEWLCFTDDDCLPASCWLRRLAKRFQTEPKCLVGGRTVNALTGNPFAATSQMLIDAVYHYHNPRGGEARFLASNNMAVPAGAFAVMGGFNPSFRTSEDREFCARWLDGGRRMLYAPEALVLHEHDLSLGAFLKQHFHYGRGACRFLRARAGPVKDRLSAERIAFYCWLLRFPLQSVREPAAALLSEALLLLSQGASAAGFAREHLVRTAR